MIDPPPEGSCPRIGLQVTESSEIPCRVIELPVGGSDPAKITHS